jgi:hypothetical protein
LVLAAALLAAGCEREVAQQPGDPVDAAALANRIEAVAEPEEKDPPPPPRLAALAAADIPREYRTGPACRLQQGDRLLLLATPLGALVRVDGRVARLGIGAPAGPSGGFFEAAGVTVSVGRPADGPGGDGRAGATIGGNPKRPIERLTARWACTR